jgi:hypothetical protein
MSNKNYSTNSCATRVFLGLPSDWIRTKDYMEPTQIDKRASKRYGYIPDYSIWKTGFPLAIVEAKSPDESIEEAIREARLYATEINKRYPPNINPIAYILASNGKKFALTQWDSETEILYATAVDLQPGTAILAAFRSILNRDDFEQRAGHLDRQFQGARFHRVPTLLGASRVSEQMGINSFAQELFPVVTKYFGTEADEASDDIIDRGYVSSEERGEYDGVLETYLKDRARVASDGRLQPITTSRSNASGISKEISLYPSPGKTGS